MLTKEELEKIEEEGKGLTIVRELLEHIKELQKKQDWYEKIRGRWRSHG